MVPLLMSLALRPKRLYLDRLFQRMIPVFNQCMILAIVWMALSGAREAVLGLLSNSTHDKTQRR